MLSNNAENISALWWDSVAQKWWPLTLDEWSAFRDRKFALTTTGPGERFFVVVVEDDDRSIANIIPHHVKIDDGGNYESHISVLSDAEAAEMDRLGILKEPTAAEQRRYEELGQKGYLAALPPLEAAIRLLRDLSAPPSLDEAHGINSFLSACGIPTTTRLRQ